MNIISSNWDFSGDQRVNNLLSNAGKVVYIPSLRTKISQATRQLRSCALEPQCSK